MPTTTDTFGNPIDPVAGFARGTIIKSATEEGLRLKNGQRIAAQRVAQSGPESISIFSGNQRDFPIRAQDIHTHCDEWVGPGIFAEELHRAALAHLGGDPANQVAVFNRTSAGIIASIIALSDSSPVVSISPRRGRSHASVVHGARLAGAELVSVQIDDAWEEAIAKHSPALVIVTTVTSGLERMNDSDIAGAVARAHENGAIVLLDEAYGARLRPVLYDGKLSLDLGADLSVTNCDKAGLSGPRAGLLMGRGDFVAKVAATGASFGMEARAPIAAGALRSLQNFQPELLRQEAREGQELAAALSEQYPADVVHTSDLGPMVLEDDILADILRRASLDSTKIVPAEATSALGTLLLRDYGILTVNTHGQPGARVSLRLKPTTGAIARAGGVTAVAEAVAASSQKLADIITDHNQVAELIVGEQA